MRLLIAASLLLTGCGALSPGGTANLAEILQAAGQDPATVCISGAYAGAAISYARTAIQNGEVDCNSGHLIIKSTAPPSISVPVQVAPQGLAPLKP